MGKAIVCGEENLSNSSSDSSDAKFNVKQMLDGLIATERSHGKRLKNLLFGPYAFIDVRDGREEVDEDGSRKNFVEVAVLLRLIKSIFKSWEGSNERLSIRVVSPFNFHTREIKRRLKDSYPFKNGFDVKVSSIDECTGEEDDAIILSTVVCNAEGSIGLLDDIVRMNAALTSARHCLWILGNAQTLLKCGSKCCEELVHESKNHRCFYNANDIKILVRIIRHVNCELDELDGVFNSESPHLWKIFFSADFKISLARLMPHEIKRAVILMLLRLSNGWRSKRNTAILSDSYQFAKIYMVKEHYLVWSVDIVKDGSFIQVIKVWNILPFTHLEEFKERLGYAFSMYTDNYLSICRERCSDGNIEVPKCWDANHEIIRYKKHCKQDTEHVQNKSSVLKNSKVSESLTSMKFYALTSQIASHLLSGNDGIELNLPFELTEEEKEVVCFTRSSFVLGRSGTGKTTVLTTKLVQKERQYFISLHGLGPSSYDCSKETLRNISYVELEKFFLRQMFLTVSPKLCMAIQDHISQLSCFSSTGRYGSSKSIEMHDVNDPMADFTDIPHTFHDLPHKHFPLIITFMKFLMMLDGTMGSSFFNKFSSIRTFSSKGRDIPKSLELSIFMSKEVDYKRFAGSYWPHFNAHLTKKLDASIVYTEIISHIKGGFESGALVDGKLGREDYKMLTEKRLSSFCDEIRDNIYDIFLNYEKIKSTNEEFDISDFVIDLHLRLKTEGYIGDKFDFVFVDEVQDFTMGQIALLKYVCNNYEDGFIFAGDTAQTIARGVDFRFEDIRCLFYKEFMPELSIKKPNLGKKEQISDIFQLIQNFRTHSGILDLANSVVDLLYRFFPSNVDKLVPETSVVCGKAPVLLESRKDENAIFKMFKSSEDKGSSNIEFGAEQVILVRDENSKRQIVDIAGNKALVLTIVESKGLEFQDVLLFNFFEGSPFKNNWRVLYELMNEKGFAGQTGLNSFPTFNHGRHHLLCSELKQLYVAITRTRQRLWICESSNEYCKPIFDFWKRSCLVQEGDFDESCAQISTSVSTREEWRLRGIKLFNEDNFEMAKTCFVRAEDTYRIKWAEAAYLVSKADGMISLMPKDAEALLKKAASVYESIGKAESAIACYIKARDFNFAGEKYLKTFGDSKLELAGDCFAMGKNWPRASSVYGKAKLFSKCLSMCSQGELFLDGLNFIKQWKDDSLFNNLNQLDKDEVCESFVSSYIVQYVKVGEIDRIAELSKALQSMIFVRKFMRSRSFLDKLLELETVLGNYVEAAGLANIKGDDLLEGDLLMKASHFELAGNCFDRAKNWLKASNAYGKARCFTRCLFMCSKGELFDEGLNFIKQWKEDSYFKKVEQDYLMTSFLSSYALHHAKIRDIGRIAELAKTLGSTDFLQKLLKSHNYFGVLSELEDMMNRQYLEAAAIAHFEGNILLESDLLHKAAHFEMAADLIIAHVAANSLWASGSKGCWPLKTFAQKNELLYKAKMIAEKASKIFNDCISSEVYVLSDTSKDLINLSEHLIEARKYQCLRLEVFILREIINVHLLCESSKYTWEPEIESLDLEKHANLTMSKNLCSAESLTHIWKLWTEKILPALNFEHYQQFHFDYFGVLMDSEQNSVILLSPEAAWINDKSKTVKKNRVILKMKIRRFKAYAKRHFQLELLSIGLTVLEKLESLLSFINRHAKNNYNAEVSKDAVTNFFSEIKISCPFETCNIISAILDVVQFLRDPAIMYDKNVIEFTKDATLRKSGTALEAINRMKAIFTYPCEYVFRMLFPAKWNGKSCFSRLNIYSNDIRVKTIINRFVDTSLSHVDNKLTPAMAAKSVMQLFLTGDINFMVYDKIATKLMPPWSDLICILKNFKNFSYLKFSLIWKLEEALNYAFDAIKKGQYDYIPPHCFMYLLDCLLFCGSSCLRSGGLFFTSKSTLSEFLRCHGLKAYMETCFVEMEFNSSHHCLNSIIEMIETLLIGKEDVHKWLIASADELDYGHLITRMVVSLCLASLNAGRTLYLSEFLLQNGILEDLQEEFRDATVGCWVHRQNVTDLARALRMVCDSLVIVSSEGYDFYFSKVSAIVLSSEELMCRENVIAKLFLRA